MEIPAAPQAQLPVDLLPLAENPFVRGPLLTFMANWVAAHPAGTDDECFFGFLAGVVTRTQIVALIRQVCPPQTLTEMCDPRLTRVPLNLCDGRARDILLNVWEHPATHEVFKPALVQLLRTQAAASRHAALQSRDQNLFHRRFDELVRLFSLSDLEPELLLLAYTWHAKIWEPLESRPGRISKGRADRLRAIAVLLGQPVAVVAELLADSGKLRKYGCLDDSFDFKDDLDGFLSGVRTEPLVSQYFSRQSEPALPWHTHGPLAEHHGTFLKAMLQARQPGHGLNFLFYGEPGTGKTSFAASLALELGWDLYLISSAERQGRGGVDFRFSALQICDAQVDPTRSLVVIDEADELLRGATDFVSVLLGGGRGRAGDKGKLNTVLDGLKTCCLWITNTGPEELDPSSRRRFDYSIRFERLSRDQRLNVWQNAIGRYGLETAIAVPVVARLADRYAISAGGIDLALRNAARILKHPDHAENPAGRHGDVEELLHKVLAPHCELLGVTPGQGTQATTSGYSLDGLNIHGKISPARIVEAIRGFRCRQSSGSPPGPDAPRMNLLLHGSPGTGKTEFVKHLGQVLDCPVHTRMGGDFLNKYVGGTEDRIRAAFRQAAAERAILFLDEADGMFHSRQFAERNWEITQVNELLHFMENFTGILICATNAYESLDPATLRRFTFKLQFDYLDAAGKVSFYERMFRKLCAEPLSQVQRQRLTCIDNLAPGDFRTVRQAFYYLQDRLIPHEQLLAALDQESAAKQQDRPGRRRIGFHGEQS